MQRILITGSNRGIGLALVKAYLEKGDVHIFAACRQPENADQLHALAGQYSGNMTLFALDINDAAMIDSAVEAVSAETDALDVLVNNAGIFPKGEDESRFFGKLSAPQLNRVVTTNSVSPVIVTQAFSGLLKGDNPRVVMISSNMGSIANARRATGSYAYRMSKAALNMATVLLSNDLPEVTVVTMHPGWVQTDMGGSEASITPQTSAQGIMTVIEGLTPADNGAFYDYRGETLPW